jgi:uncharacterized membrane protein (UPF0127 family)
MLRIVNMRTGETVADTVEVADTRTTRKRGLLGRDGLESGSALVLSPCFAVHTAFMRFAIDVVFVDRDGYVVRAVHNLGPWRMAAAVRAQQVIELPAGELARRGLREGDRVYLATADAEGRSSALSSLADISFRRTATKPACSRS